MKLCLPTVSDANASRRKEKCLVLRETVKSRFQSIAQSKSHHTVIYLNAFQQGHSFKTGKRDAVRVCVRCWLILEIMGMLQLSHASRENEIVLFRTRWTARIELTTSTYQCKQRGSGVFACICDIFSEHSTSAGFKRVFSGKIGPERQLHKNITTAHRHPFSTTMSIASGQSLTLTMCFSKRGLCELMVHVGGFVCCVRSEIKTGSDIYSWEPSGVCAGPVAIITHHILILAPMESKAFDYS